MIAAMNDLDRLREAPVPRPWALCRRYSWTIDSIGGFIAYGALWFFAAGAIATAGLFAGIAIVGDDPGPFGRTVVVAIWIVSYVGAWGLFAWWVVRRRRSEER